MRKLAILICCFLLVLGGCSTEIKKKEDVFNIRMTPLVNEKLTDDLIDQLEASMEVTINVIEGSNLDEQKIYLEMSTKEQYDLVITSPDIFSQIDVHGQALSLNQYLEDYGTHILKYNSQGIDACTNADGSINCLGFSHDQNLQKLLINDELLKEYSLTVPTNQESMQQSICDLSLEGVKNPWITNNSSVYNDLVMRDLFGVGSDWDYDVSGQMVHISENPGYLDYLKYMRELYLCGGLGLDYQFLTPEDQVKLMPANGAFTSINTNHASELLETNNYAFIESIDPLIASTQGQSEITSVLYIPVYMEQYAVSIIKLVDKAYELKGQVHQTTDLSSPIESSVFLPNYYMTESCIKREMVSFSNYYILGQKTDQDFDVLNSYLDETCNIGDVKAELNMGE